MNKRKWYLSVPIIVGLSAMWFFVIPGILAIIFAFLRMKNDKEVKKIWEENDLEKLMNDVKMKNDLAKDIENLEESKREIEEHLKPLLEFKKLEELKESLEIEINLAKGKLNKVEVEIDEKSREIIELDDEILYQSFGFYEPRYNLESSVEYKNYIDKVRLMQKDLVKANIATHHPDIWLLNDCKKQGAAMIKNNVKLIIRSFNNECDVAVSKVKFNNFDSMEKRIKTSYKTLNNVNKHLKVEITQQYLTLKLEELQLSYEYEQKKQEEKEEQQRIKEQMREEAKAQKEIQREKEKIEKEEKHFSTELERLKIKLKESSEEQQNTLHEKIKELEAKLKLLEKDKKNVFDREQNTRAGYVYIISNVGSFGENIYKIGMTRRLEPMERVNELGSASVPFKFDVHAMIFSDDAPKLESALHRHFMDRSVNKINLRKEFFNVSLKEIQEVVEKNHNKTVEFTVLAEASEYRQSLAISSDSAKNLKIA